MKFRPAKFFDMGDTAPLYLFVSGAREASHQPTFMGNCLTISHSCLPWLPSGRVSPCVPGVIEWSGDAWGAVDVGHRWDASVWNF